MGKRMEHFHNSRITKYLKMYVGSSGEGNLKSQSDTITDY